MKLPSRCPVAQFDVISDDRYANRSCKFASGNLHLSATLNDRIGDFGDDAAMSMLRQRADAAPAIAAIAQIRKVRSV